METEPNDSEFRSAVERHVVPALDRLGFIVETFKSDLLWDGYFFQKGDERICIYYLEKDLEFNFMYSAVGGELFNHPFKASGAWESGTAAIERVRGARISEAELVEIGSYLLRSVDEIANLLVSQIVEVVGPHR